MRTLGLTNQSVATFADGEAAGRHGILYTGKSWYVDSVLGDDGNSGFYPDVPFATIGAALLVVAAGDAIILKTGVYDEGVDLTLDGLELHGETGAILINTDPGTVLTVSGDFCLVEGVLVAQAGQIGVLITGEGCQFWESFVTASTVGWDVNDGAIFVRCISAGHTVTGFDIGVSNCTIYQCNAIGASTATRGFYLSAAAADRNILNECISSGNMTAGYEIVVGADNNTLMNCSSGGEDGLRVDNGLNNAWPQYSGALEQFAHEEPYPEADGEGAAITVPSISSQANDATDAALTTRWYWGEPTVIIPRDTIANAYYIYGLHFQAVTAAKVLQWQLFTNSEALTSAMNGGNAWDEGETDLTVVDGALFEDQDLVAVYGNVVEIMRVNGAPAGNVVTVERETVNMATPNGLRWVHAGTRELAVVHREGSGGLHSSQGNYLTLAAGIAPRFLFFQGRPVGGNAFALLRIMNMTDAVDCTAAMTAIIER